MTIGQSDVWSKNSKDFQTFVKEMNDISGMPCLRFQHWPPELATCRPLKREYELRALTKKKSRWWGRLRSSIEFTGRLYAQQAGTDLRDQAKAASQSPPSFHAGQPPIQSPKIHFSPPPRVVGLAPPTFVCPILLCLLHSYKNFPRNLRPANGNRLAIHVSDRTISSVNVTVTHPRSHSQLAWLLILIKIWNKLFQLWPPIALRWQTCIFHLALLLSENLVCWSNKSFFKPWQKYTRQDVMTFLLQNNKKRNKIHMLAKIKLFW